jgi:hypothetical protein
MPRSALFRMIFAAILAAPLFPAAALSQSQDSQSVAEAARRAREKKKDAPKSTKVITDETLDVKKGDVQSAVAEEDKIPGAPDTKGQAANGAANPTAANPATQAEKDEKLKKEVTAVKEQLKQALMDLDLLQRENRLDQDAYYAKPNYASDTAGKQKLDDEQQQISDKRQRSLGESSPSQP